jgi:hypothetical protein
VPWLRPVWRDAHWRVYAVDRPAALADGAAAVTRLGPDSIDLEATRAGDVRLRVHFTPYWAVVRGDACVERAAGDWTRLRVRRAGSLRIATRFAPGRIVSRGVRCPG